MCVLTRPRPNILWSQPGIRLPCTSQTANQGATVENYMKQEKNLVMGEGLEGGGRLAGGWGVHGKLIQTKAPVEREYVKTPSKRQPRWSGNNTERQEQQHADMEKNSQRNQKQRHGTLCPCRARRPPPLFPDATKEGGQKLHL